MGHHWSYIREQGEPQITVNYTKALSDFITNFTFSRGVSFRSPEETSAIVPALLDRVWTVDNEGPLVFWEMGQQGGVTGDCFVKVAYEEPRVWPADENGQPIQGVPQRFIPGKVRVLVLNSAHCLTEDTEILTRRGWLSHDQLTIDDQVLSMDPTSEELVWAGVHDVVRRRLNPDEKIHEWRNERFSAASTSGHRWMLQGRAGVYERTTEQLHDVRRRGTRLRVAGGAPTHFPLEAKYTDEFVELAGWVATEGALEPGSAAFVVHQSRKHNPAFCARIERIARAYEQQGIGVYRFLRDENQCWRFSAVLGREIRGVLDEHKAPRPEFLTSLTFAQAKLLYDTMLDGDGDTRRARGDYFWQNNWAVMDAFQMLAMMLGKRSQARMKSRKRSYDEQDCQAGQVTVYANDVVSLGSMDKREVEGYEGIVWCPVTSTSTWVARRKEVMQDGSSSKVIYLTGNCFP